MAKKKTSKWIVVRLLASGALLGVAIAGVLGVDTSAMASTIFGASGAVIAGALLKAAHVI